MKSLLHIWCGRFLPVTVEEWGATFVQFRGKSLPLTFSFEETTASKLHNALLNMHQWVLLPYCIDVLARTAAGETHFVSEWYGSTGSGLDSSLSAVTNVLFSPLTQNNYCWMDMTTNKSMLYFFSSFLIYKWKSPVLDFPKRTGGGQKDVQDTKWNNRRVVLRMAARSVFFVFVFLSNSRFIFHLFSAD